MSPSRMGDAVRSAWESVLAHRFRSALTMLGMVIGVASVITVVSMIQGLSQSVRSSFDGLGSNSLTVHSYTSFEDQMRGRSNRITQEDFLRLRRHLDGITDISASFSPYGKYGTNVKNGQRTSFTRVMAVDPSYQETYRIYPEAGRFISFGDESSRRKVVVLGTKLARDLKMPVDPVGRFIEIGDDWFKVIGVMEERGDLLGLSQDDYALVPFATGSAASGNSNEIDLTISFNVIDPMAIGKVRDRAMAILREAHGRGKDDEFKVETAEQLMKSFTGIFDVFTAVIGGIVSVSLLVGGIGIMNIMLVSVTERTREIGICKAIGATRNDILLQFLLESLFISLLGAAIGVVVGAMLGMAASHLIPGFPSPSIPAWAIAMAVGFCASIGLVFGVVPAVKAANLRPIEALRYE